MFVRVSPCYKSVSYLSARDYLHVINVSSRSDKSMTPYLINVKRYFSLHNSRFMSQARRTRHLLEARNECEARDEGWRKIKLYFSPPLVASRASCKMPLSPRLAHKAPFMQAGGISASSLS